MYIQRMCAWVLCVFPEKLRKNANRAIFAGKNGDNIGTIKIATFILWCSNGKWKKEMVHDRTMASHFQWIYMYIC